MSDGEHSFAEFMVDEDDDKLLVPANINSNADLCTVLDEVLAVSSDLSKDICEELDKPRKSNMQDLAESKI